MRCHFKRKDKMDTKDMIFIGSDHAGFQLKEHLKKYLRDKGYEYKDMGNKEIDPADDYPIFAQLVAKETAKTGGRGIVICSSGVGVCIAANKVKHIRAVNASNEEMAAQSRLHNDSNVLCLGQNFVTEEEAEKITKKWLETSFSNEARHQRRVDKIADIEN